MESQKWPSQLWLIRHGQSAGNVASDVAEAARAAVVDIAYRDVDVPLSELGERQARALGDWIAQCESGRRPTVVLCSPYVRAKQTARLMLEHAAPSHSEDFSIRYDERLREKEFGILDGLTRHGVRERYPELEEQRQHVGKFYFRPPGGESWCDVILRLRSVIDMMVRDHAGERVVIVGHQVIVNCLRYLLERLDEAEILAIDRQADVPNCSITSYQLDPSRGRLGKLVLEHANFVVPLEREGATVTDAPDQRTAPKS